MRANFGSGIRLKPGNNPFFSILKIPRSPPYNHFQTLTLAMVPATSPNKKRPTCPSCSRPTKLCLCTRFKTPLLENSIAVTILQHSLEKKHPLNSTRIAALGLKNLSVTWVSDVLIEALFHIQFLEPNLEVGFHNSVEIHRKEESFQSPAISFTIEKKGAIKSFQHIWNESLDFNELLGSPVAIDGLKNGFKVKRMQKKELESSDFEIEVSPGSVLLFPSENSIGVEEVDFEVRNLIVLDGTWAKATKMYKENPWLKLVPHVKLDVDEVSLYGEVRREPKAGYLSSIESIVYALKALGEDLEGLDGLLDVFESMVRDQRRCKNERLSNVSSM